MIGVGIRLMQIAVRRLLGGGGGGGGPTAPAGQVLLVDADGAYLADPDSADLTEPTS